MNLLSKTQVQFNQVNSKKDGTKRKFLIISNFGNTSVKSEETSLKDYFRIFTPVKPEKNRKINAYYGGIFNSRKDSLLDYPTIVKHMLASAEPWENFNRLISVHIPLCPLNCWHCYLEECLRCECNQCISDAGCSGTKKKTNQLKVEWITAQELVEAFLEQRAEDKRKGISSNILRITGGEPLLVPNLLVEILEELKLRGLENEVFLWAETNLIPLIVIDGQDVIISDSLLFEMSKYKNFCIHPCFHGLDVANFDEITGEKIDNFDRLIVAFKRLIEAGIAVFPSFGSNMSSPKAVEDFFYKIYQIDNNLPLRFCLIEYDLEYEPIKLRRKNKDFAQAHQKVYDRFQNIEVWDSLLHKHLAREYAELPRHLINNIIKTGIEYSDNTSTAHLFHWASADSYQKKALEIIALPTGTRNSISYSKKYIHELFFRKISKTTESKSVETIFWLLNCEVLDGKTEFRFAYPLRKILVNKIRDDGVSYTIDFIAQDFVEGAMYFEGLQELSDFMKIPFGQFGLQCPGSEKGYGHTGPKLELSECLGPDLEQLYEKVMSHINCLPLEDCRKISEFPLVHVKSIKQNNNDVVKVNSDGFYEINPANTYKITLQFYQGHLRRNRSIEINDCKVQGKNDNYDLLIQEKDENRSGINIKIKFRVPNGDSLDDYDILIPAQIKRPKYIKIVKSKWTHLLVLILASVVTLFSFYKYAGILIQGTEDKMIAPTLAIGTSLVVLIVTKLFETFAKD